MSLDPPSYLQSLQNNIRARPIPWDGAVRAGHLTEAQLKRIRLADKVRKEQRRRTVESDLAGFTTLLLGGSDGEEQSVLETAAKRGDVMQYILVFMGDLLDVLAGAIADPIEHVPPLMPELLRHPRPYRLFVPLLRHSDNAEEPIPLLASSVLASLLAAAVVRSASSAAFPLSADAEHALEQLFAYLSALAGSADSGFQDIAVQEYSALLRSRRAREIFWRLRHKTLSPLMDVLLAAVGAGAGHGGRNGGGGSSSGGGGDDTSTLWSGVGGPSSLGTTLRNGSESGSIGGGGGGGASTLGGGVGLQLLYHILLVLWQLSFDAEMVGEGLQEEHDIVPLYTELLRLSPKEKTTRVLAATLHNLLRDGRSGAALLPLASLARLPALLPLVRGRRLTDPDLLDDLAGLAQLCDEYGRTQTTFDEYAAEVRAGRLRWSPPHRNAAFWAENARRVVEHNGGELVRRLADILAGGGSGGKRGASSVAGGAAGGEQEGEEQEGEREEENGGRQQPQRQQQTASEDDRRQRYEMLAVACNDVRWLVKQAPELRGRLEKYGLKARVMALMTEPDEQVRWESLQAVGEWLRYHG